MVFRYILNMVTYSVCLPSGENPGICLFQVLESSGKCVYEPCHRYC